MSNIEALNIVGWNREELIAQVQAEHPKVDEWIVTGLVDLFIEGKLKKEDLEVKRFVSVQDADKTAEILQQHASELEELP